MIIDWTNGVRAPAEVEKLILLRQLHTKRRGRVTNAPTPYSGGPGFDSRTLQPTILIEVFVAFLSLSGE
jgi:hypothetical protein